MEDTRFESLFRDIYEYYGSPVVPVEGNRQALMLRATGEPFTAEEIEVCTSHGKGISCYEDLWRIARAKRAAGMAQRTNNGSQQALVDDYGNVINLSVSECKEIVDSFKALVQLRMAVDDENRETTIPIKYFHNIMLSTGDRIDPRHMDILLSMLHGYNGHMSLRGLLKLLSRVEHF
ncbi:hypothetical protein BgAZ_201900 [Babesia gibsoni]|uniref:Uncharacterized protein n=1 Tax=Babesia gibsoni TaxID=33632 RepID=A0AAD8PDU4_BABGI|nr:hypothetical protein BgAZ_201900 [Babesia gibsoni]